MLFMLKMFQNLVLDNIELFFNRLYFSRLVSYSQFEKLHTHNMCIPRAYFKSAFLITKLFLKNIAHKHDACGRYAEIISRYLTFWQKRARIVAA